MDAPGTVPDSINCHACGALINLTGQTGFTHIECARCGALSVVPLQFGDLLLLNPIGIGGMGTVYRAIDLSLNRFLALKILRKKAPSNREFIEHFCREARAAASVNHPNIAQVYSFGERDGQHYLAMELLERGSLDDRIVKLGKLPEKDVLDIGLQVASGLRAAWQRGLLHRDIKPGNILFSEDGVPKIVDFGLARAHVPQPLQTGPPQAQTPEAIWGTPYYVAPEKLRGQAEDFRSDIYSLGATLFHALAGRPPFDAATAGEVITKHATQPAYSLKTYAPSTHDFTAHVIARMLAKNPAERYESYDELIRDFEAALAALKAAESARAIVASTGEQFSLGSLIATVVAVVLCGAVVWFVWTYRVSIFNLESPPQPEAQKITGPEPGVTPEPAAPGPQEEQVNFAEDAPWVKAWNVATLQLAQGRYNDALFGYDSALRLVGRAQPKHRQWIHYFQALTLLAADRPGEAKHILSTVLDPGLKPQVPATITTANFVDPLLMTMLGLLPLEELEAAIPRMPAWAAALTHFSAGFKLLEAGQFNKAAESFRRYNQLERDTQQPWAFNLQPLADKLARQCDSAALTVAEIDALESGGKLDEALKRLRAAAESATLTALKVHLLTRQTQLQRAVAQQRETLQQAQRQAEQARLEQQERQRLIAQQETEALQNIEPKISQLWQSYDFAGAVAQYEALAGQMQSEQARRLLERRLERARRLVQFKSQLRTDFATRPYDRGDLRTRNQTPLPGRLVRASQTHLVFATPYGEILVDWRELAPATLAKLAEHYALAHAATEAPRARAQRYLLMTVFCQQYGLERAAADYAQQAGRLDAELRPQLDSITEPPSP